VGCRSVWREMRKPLGEGQGNEGSDVMFEYRVDMTVGAASCRIGFKVSRIRCGNEELLKSTFVNL
jgi:hypothetical protein